MKSPTCSRPTRASRRGRWRASRLAARCRASPCAIKGVLARADDTPTLVFDEVDAGIGGRSADPVGRSLWQLARSHQVICVTHLPQIAAYADTHLRITKGFRGERTVTEIERLEDDARLDELSLMLGGSSVDDGARAAAAELLARAERVRDETSAVGA